MALAAVRSWQATCSTCISARGRPLAPKQTQAAVQIRWGFSMPDLRPRSTILHMPCARVALCPFQPPFTCPYMRWSILSSARLLLANMII